MASLFKMTDESRKWWVLIAMGASVGLIMLDETVVGIALPTIRRDLGMSEVATHWVVSVYMLVLTGVAAASGKLGDIFGFRVVFLVGAAIFGLASLAAGFAESGGFLIAARAVEGVGAAVFLTLSIPMIAVVFPKEKRGMAIGVLAAIGTTFLALGPLVGGVLTELVSWRWIFWVNVPIVLLATPIILAAWTDPPRASERPRFDYGGLVTLVIGLSLLVFAIMQGVSWGWTRNVILGCLAGGLAILALFFLIERRRTAPLIEIGLFRIPTFSACNFVLFAGQYSKIALAVFGALYLQDDLGMSPLVAGLALLVSVAAFPILSAPVGRIADKYGARRPVVLGLTLATLAMVWVGLAADWKSYALLWPGLLLWGCGMVLSYSPALRAMTNAVPVDKQGQTSGIFATSRLLGGTMGMAVCSTLYVGTGSFQVVFLMTAVVLLAALAAAWLAIDRPKNVGQGSGKMAG